MLSRSLRRMVALSVVAVLALADIAHASDVDVAVIDVTAPTNAVALSAGESAPITINLSVTGNQAGTATFEVYRDWTLSAGAFAGSNPQEFTVGPRVGGQAATTFTTTGTVTVSAGQAAGTFDLEFGVFDITNSNTTGGKLAAGDDASYAVTVRAPVRVDTTPPVVLYTLDPAEPQSNGWYNTDVTIAWTVTDPESSVTKIGCVDQTITTDGDHAPSCTASSDGGSAGTVTAWFKRDATAPTVGVHSVSPAANGAGWHNEDVTVTFRATDALSGFATGSIEDREVTSTGEGEAVALNSPAFTDQAGNTTALAAASETVMIDKPRPAVSVQGVSDGQTYTLGEVPDVGCATTDALSGVKHAAALTTTGGPVGPVTVSCDGAADHAGNTGSATATFTVHYP